MKNFIALCILLVLCSCSDITNQTKEYNGTIVFKTPDGTKNIQSYRIDANSDSAAYAINYLKLLAEIEVYSSNSYTRTQPMPMLVGVVTNDVGEIINITEEKKKQIERTIDSIEINVFKRNFKDSLNK